jgi:SAM-dependent methyltransferase
MVHHDHSDRGVAEPSPWVVRFADLVPAGGTVLDLACGAGRHTRFFLERAHPVVAVDIDVTGIADLAGHPGLEPLEVDLEDGRPFPLAGRSFAGVIVTNYLHRQLLPELVAAVAPGGAFIYETFARGHERFGLPTNPHFLLEPGELLEAVRGRLRVVAYQDLVVEEPRAAAVQRICALRQASTGRSNRASSTSMVATR